MSVSTLPVFVRLQVHLKRCAVLSLAIISVSTPSLLPVALCVRFVAVRDAETRRAWQQQQANANAAAEAAALQAMHEESTRLAGEHKGGRVTSNFYLERTAVLYKKIEFSIFCVCTSSVLRAACCFGVRHNVTFYRLSCDVILSTKVLNITALFAWLLLLLLFVVFLTLTDPLRIQPRSQDRRNQNQIKPGIGDKQGK